MAGDYTRFTHKPKKHYTGVLMQQGRVQLDADWNEQLAIQKRRWEIQAYDTFCGCRVPETTLEAFKVTEFEEGDFKLGPGRMYVAGVLAENFDEEEKVTYKNQPYYPDPKPLSVPDQLGLPLKEPLVYIDVWDREVTWIQDRELLETALQGPDTATRIQTVWQVKVTEGTCETNLNAMFPPSAGRLSSGAVALPAIEDPCIVAPAGDYRGLENQLYRVEIHDPGTTGDILDVRFKWSRENASVVSPVEAITPAGNLSELTVPRIGRDPVLRFKVDDWVEVQDDYRELEGKPGIMAQIKTVDEANRKITLDPQSPTTVFDASTPERHTRLIRWDQTGDNNLDNGLMKGSGNWILLENGVEIQLSKNPNPLTDWFHVGDYWVFHARTVDGSVEELLEAPPRGIIHHYCALADLNRLGGPQPEPGAGGPLDGDCREIWYCERGKVPQPDLPQPESGCCLTVRPGGDPKAIQKALDSLLPDGGCVCLMAGKHEIKEPIHIKGSNITLHGASVGAKVERPNGIRALTIGSDGIILQDISVQDIHFAVSMPAGDMADSLEILEINKCKDVRVANCHMSVTGEDAVNAAIPVVGIGIHDSSSIEILDNRLSEVVEGVSGQDSGSVRVCGNDFNRQNLVIMTTGVSSKGQGSGSELWHVEGNRIQNFSTGIVVEAQGSIVASNMITFQNVIANNIPENITGIDCTAANCNIQQNTIETLVDVRFFGVSASASYTRIENNTVICRTFVAQCHGIYLFSREGPPVQASPNNCDIRCNTLLGQRSLNAIVVEGTEALAVQAVCILENRIGPSDVGEQLAYGIQLFSTSSVKIATNRIRETTAVGIEVTDAKNLTLESNVLEELEGRALRARTLTGTTSVIANYFSGKTVDEDDDYVALVEIHEDAGDDNDVKIARILFNNNVCDHRWGAQNEKEATVSFKGKDMIVMGNRVNGQDRTKPSMDFHGSGQSPVVGLMTNLVSGKFINLGMLYPSDPEHLKYNVELLPS